MKRTLILLAIILLIIVNLAAFATMAYFRWLRHENFHPGPGPRHSVSSLRRELELSDEQVERLKKHRASFDERIDEIRSTLRQRREQLMDALQETAPDTALINHIVDVIGTLQTEIEKQAIGHMLEAKEILTPEQHEQFISLFQEHFHRHGLIPRPKRMRPGESPWRPFETDEEKDRGEHRSPDHNGR